jgi:peroxiredoxin
MVRNFILGLILIVFASACQTKEKPKDEVVLEAKSTANNDMPAFNITQVDGSRVVFKEVSGKVLIVFFNPGCDHCQREAKLLSENKDVIKDYQVYFVSPEPMDSIAKFSVDYKLLEPNVHFGQGEASSILSAVGPITTVPTFMLYDNQAFVARMEGEISLEKLRQMLK